MIKEIKKEMFNKLQSSNEVKKNCVCLTYNLDSDQKGPEYFCYYCIYVFTSHLQQLRYIATDNFNFTLDVVYRDLDSKLRFCILVNIL